MAVHKTAHSLVVLIYKGFEMSISEISAATLEMDES